MRVRRKFEHVAQCRLLALGPRARSPAHPRAAAAAAVEPAVGQQARRDLRHRQHPVDHAGGDGRCAASRDAGFVRILRDRQPAALLDALDADRAVAVRARQHDRRGMRPMGVRERAEEHIHRDPCPRAGVAVQPQLAVDRREPLARRNHVDAVRLRRAPSSPARPASAWMLQHFGQDALVVGRQVQTRPRTPCPSRPASCGRTTAAPGCCRPNRRGRRSAAKRWRVAQQSRAGCRRGLAPQFPSLLSPWAAARQLCPPVISLQSPPKTPSGESLASIRPPHGAGAPACVGARGLSDDPADASAVPDAHPTWRRCPCQGAALTEISNPADRNRGTSASPIAVAGVSTPPRCGAPGSFGPSNASARPASHRMRNVARLPGSPP